MGSPHPDSGRPSGARADSPSRTVPREPATQDASRARDAEPAGEISPPLPAAEDAPATLSAEPHASAPIGRPSKTEPFRELVARLLDENPTRGSWEIFRAARQLGYRGGRSAMYALINALRPPVPHGSFDGLPGESSQHDFGQVDVRFSSGTRARLRFFASRLTYSRWLAVTLIPDEQPETLARTLFDHLELFGGVPLLALFDRPHAVTPHLREGGNVADWNELVAGLARDLGLGLDVRPSGTRRLATDHLVQWVKENFFHAQTFVDLADVRQRLAEWLSTTNTVHSSRYGLVPSVALEQERHRLRPIRISRKDLALRATIVVNADGTVVYETFAFPMPHQAAGLAGTLLLYPDRAQIVAGPFSADFRR